MNDKPYRPLGARVSLGGMIVVFGLIAAVALAVVLAPQREPDRHSEKQQRRAVDLRPVEPQELTPAEQKWVARREELSRKLPVHPRREALDSLAPMLASIDGGCEVLPDDARVEPYRKGLRTLARYFNTTEAEIAYVTIGCRHRLLAVGNVTGVSCIEIMRSQNRMVKQLGRDWAAKPGNAYPHACNVIVQLAHFIKKSSPGERFPLRTWPPYRPPYR